MRLSSFSFQLKKHLKKAFLFSHFSQLFKPVMFKIRLDEETVVSSSSRILIITGSPFYYDLRLWVLSFNLLVFWCAGGSQVEVPGPLEDQDLHGAWGAGASSSEYSLTSTPSPGPPSYRRAALDTGPPAIGSPRRSPRLWCLASDRSSGLERIRFDG